MNFHIEDVVKKNLCVGCGACASLFKTPAARMELANSGFLRPVQLRELNSAEVAVFSDICPGVGVAHANRGPQFLPLWGPVHKVQAGHAADEQVRYLGSSGGVLSALAIFLLESGKVQGVLHIAPDPHKPFDNPSQISRCREDVLKAAGSRYAPASPLDRVRECLELPGIFAFIGKPCDVAALRAMARKFPEVASKFRYMLSFMCAGTPSIRGTEEVVRHLGFQPQDVTYFRYRGNGWPGMARAETADGASAEMDYDSSWGKILNRHLQFRCKICPDGTGEFSDVSCADAWHSDKKGYPIFTETNGRSLIIARTALGQELLESAEQADRLKTENMDIATVATMQPYQTNRKQALIARLIGFKLGGQAIPKYRNFVLMTAARGMPFLVHIKNATGAWLRAVGIRNKT